MDILSLKKSILLEWETIEDNILTHEYKSLSSVIFQKERWFTDKINKDLTLVETMQFKKINTQLYLAFNLFTLGTEYKYYYYIPLIISYKKEIKDGQLFFVKNDYYFYDAISTSYYVLLLDELFKGSFSFATKRGSFEFYLNTSIYKPQISSIRDSNNSLLFISQQYTFKNFRKIYSGVNPEYRLGIALTKLESKQIPKVYGFFRYYNSNNEYSLGIIQETIKNTGNAWDIWGKILLDKGSNGKKVLLKQAYSLGKTTAEFHSTLYEVSKMEGRETNLNIDDIQDKIKEINKLVETGLVNDLINMSCQYNNILENIKKKLLNCYLGKKFNIHGDFHLGQVIKTRAEWKILDLEGEPLKTLEERLTFESPIRDIASMICSINYRFRKIHNIQSESKHYIELLNNALIKGYLDTCSINGFDFLPQHQEFKVLLTFFRIERTIYECVHEANCRPDWFYIPYDSLNEILEKQDIDSKILYNEVK